MQAMICENSQLGRIDRHSSFLIPVRHDRRINYPVFILKVCFVEQYRAGVHPKTWKQSHCKAFQATRTSFLFCEHAVGHDAIT